MEPLIQHWLNLKIYTCFFVDNLQRKLFLLDFLIYALFPWYNKKRKKKIHLLAYYDQNWEYMRHWQWSYRVGMLRFTVIALLNLQTKKISISCVRQVGELSHHSPSPLICCRFLQSPWDLYADCSCLLFTSNFFCIVYMPIVFLYPVHRSLWPSTNMYFGFIIAAYH